MLNDVGPYDVQFRGGRPVLIDTLSFEKYSQGRPWFVYRQFCQKFLASLAVMARKEVSSRALASLFLDGALVGMASELLPVCARVNIELLSLVHFRVKAPMRWAGNSGSAKRKALSLNPSLGLGEILRSCVEGLTLRTSSIDCANYSANSD